MHNDLDFLSFPNLGFLFDDEDIASRFFSSDPHSKWIRNKTLSYTHQKESSEYTQKF